MEYSVFVALREDVNSGWVWINIPKVHERAIICIKDPATGKKVYCEALQIDDNYLKCYNAKGQGRIAIKGNSPTLVTNQWYRKKMGNLSTESKHELHIVEADKWCWKIISCFQHPQVIVRVASWLGVISVALGIVGVLFGVISLCI